MNPNVTAVRTGQNLWRNVFWALVVAGAMAFVITLSGPNQVPEVKGIVHITAVVFLCCLLGYWLGLGHSIWRIPGSVTASLVIGLIFGWSSTGPGNELYLFLMFCSIITVTTGTTGFVLRAFCGQLCQSEKPETQREALQFGVRHILIWTTVAAILIAVFQQLLNKSVDSNVVSMVSILAVSYAVIAILQIWTWLGQQLRFDKIVTLFIVFIVAIYGLQVITRHAPWFWGSITVASQVLIAMSIFCLRKQNYRFVLNSN